jgi:hypothetical protein
MLTDRQSDLFLEENAMPMDRSRYPKDWESIALKIKESVNWQCQECERPCKKTEEDWDEFLIRLAEDFDPNEVYWVCEFLEFPRRFTLTVAHLDHDPENPNARLKALCISCHGRYDLSQASRKRQISLEKRGQLSLNL